MASNQDSLISKVRQNSKNQRQKILNELEKLIEPSKLDLSQKVKRFFNSFSTIDKIFIVLYIVLVILLILTTLLLKNYPDSGIFFKIAELFSLISLLILPLIFVVLFWNKPRRVLSNSSQFILKKRIFIDTGFVFALINQRDQ
jgi:hypothetical protein